MKKTIAILLALLMVLSLAACGGGSTTTETAEGQKGNKSNDEIAKIKELLCVNDWGYWENDGRGDISFYTFRENGTASSHFYMVWENTAEYRSGSDGTYTINNDGTISMELKLDDDGTAHRNYTYTLDGDSLKLVEMFGYKGDRECFNDEWLERIWGEELSSMKKGALAYMEENYADYLYSESDG